MVGCYFVVVVVVVVVLVVREDVEIKIQKFMGKILKDF